MIAGHQNFGLDDRNQPGFLAEGRIARERFGICGDTGPAGQPVVQSDHRPPFCEACPHCPIFDQALSQTVQTAGDRLAGMSGHVLRADVDLDTGDDSRLSQDRCERHALIVLLPDGLVIQDGTTDAGCETRRRHQQSAIGAAGRLRLRDPDGGEALVAGAIALIHGE